MKTFVKKSLLWFFSLLFVVCSAFTITAFTQKSGAFAEEETPAPVASFVMTEGASIRNAEDGITGLRFEMSFNKAFLDENTTEGDVDYGMLIFPAKNLANVGGALDGANAPSYYTDVTKLDAQDVDVSNVGTGYYYASIVYSEDVVREALADKATDDNVQTVLNNLYAMDLTAVGYHKLSDGSYYYTNMYTTSMLKVASRIVAGEVEASDAVVDIAKSYLGKTIVTEKAYVMTGANAVTGLEVQASNVARVVIDNEYLVAGTDYSIVGNALTLSSDIVNAHAQAENNIDQYVNVYLYDENNNLTIVDVLFDVDEVIDSVDEFKAAFVRGDATVTDATLYPANTKTYVLGADIDLSSAGILANKLDKDCFSITAANYTTFSGILDGFGYSISNAIVKTTHAGGSGNYPAGLLGDFDNGSILKNVAFENIGTDTAGSFGLITGQFFGIMENVYVHVNKTVPYGVSTFGNVVAQSKFENVVLKVDRADNYSYPEKSQGSVFSGRFNSGVYFGDTSNNVVVIVNEPLAYQASKYEYAINETEWHSFDANVEEDFATKAKKINGVYRYDTELAFNNALKDETVTVKPSVDAFVASKMFKVAVNGDLVWHAFKPVINVDEVLEYNAEAQTLISTGLPEDFTKVTVTATKKDNTEVVSELSVGSGIEIVGDEYRFVNKTSYADVNAGVPFADNTATGVKQEMKFAFETADAIYVYNVIYYNNFIDTLTEMKDFASHNNLDANKQDFRYHKLNANIEFVGNEDFSNANITHGVNGDFGYSKTSQGFLGVFDGAGHYIKNFNPGNGGLFGALRNDGVTTTVKNLALIDVKKASQLLGQAGPYTRGAGNEVGTNFVILDNMYISYAQGIQPKGLFERIGNEAAVKMNNVVVDSSSVNSSFKLAKDNKAYGITEGHVLERAYTAVGTYPTQIFSMNLHTNWAGRLEKTAADFENAQTNVILIGRAPFVASSTNKTVDASLFTHTLNGETYTHTPAVTVPKGGWAAGNLDSSEIPMATALKPGFAELAKNSDGSALAGYICKNCYQGFSLTAGTCTCGTALTPSNDLWKEIGSYVWSLYDFDSHVTGVVGGYSFKHSGVSKYDTVADMPTGADAYTAFLGETGNDCWKVVDGKLTWKNIYSVEFEAIEDIGLALFDSNYSAVDFAPQVIVDGQKLAVTDITADSDCIEIKDGKITAKAVGSAVVTLKYSIGGKEYSTTFNVVVSANAVVNDTVDFEASSGLFKTTVVGDITKVTVTAYDVVGNPIVKELTLENGILEGGKLNALTSYADTYGDAIGVPYANNLVSVTAMDNKGIKQQMKFVVETTAGTYTFNNVMYYTDIIDNTDEFVALANWDYATTYVNANYYKLGADIDAEGLTYDKRASVVGAVFNYPSQAGSAYAGFRGRFDGDGHTISNFNPAASDTNDYGLFGALMVYDDHTQTYRLATQIVVKNVAFENIYSGPVLGKYAPTSKSKCFFDNTQPLTLLENIYVSVKEGETLRGLFGGKGGTRDQNNLNSMNIDMKNILIDATKANVKLAKDNKAYLVEGEGGALVNQFADTNVVDFQESYAIFGAWIQDAFHSGFNQTMVSRFVNEALDNVVILGNVPVALRRSAVGDNNKNNAVAHTLNEDGTTYTHSAKAKLERNDVYAYACNQTVGDIPVITGLKPAFLAAEGISTNDGSKITAYAYVCYVCGTPYPSWQQNCPNPDCGVNNNLYGGWVGNTWTTPAIYTYTVRDLTTFEHDIPNFTGLFTGNYEFVLQGVYKYNDGVIKANEVDLEAFTSTGFWSVVDGALVWGAQA